MADDTEEEPAALPAPSMLSVIVAIGIAEIEQLHPGFVDRLIGRLSSESLRSEIIAIRGARALPAVLEAQQEALVWLGAIRPLMISAPVERKRKRRD